MVTEGGATEDPVERLLSEEGRRFSFFQIVQLLERHYRTAPRVGRNGPASTEAVRFRPSASLAFPIADVDSVEQIEDEEGHPRFRVTTTFMGLYGTTSPLPAFYAEEVLWQEGENAVRAFMDLFHHRLLSLFYRCWSKYRYSIQFEAEGKDDFSRRMFGLLGIGTSGLIENTGLDSVCLIRYAGVLSQQIRSASALEGVLSDFFEGIRVRVEQFTGRWIVIIPRQQNSVGIRNCSLGSDCNIGERIFSRNSSFKIIVGPLNFSAFIHFLPGRGNFRALVSLVNFFTRDRLEFDIDLIIHEQEIPRIQLVSDGQRQQMQLGWTSYLFSEPSQRPCERSLLLRGRN